MQEDRYRQYKVMDKHTDLIEAIEKKPNKDLVSIFNEIKQQHDNLKTEVENKLTEMEKLEALFLTVDAELKKRNL